MQHLMARPKDGITVGDGKAHSQKSHLIGRLLVAAHHRLLVSKKA
jgi:hypothetical protein